MKSPIYNAIFIVTLLAGIASAFLIGMTDVGTKPAITPVVEADHVAEVANRNSNFALGQASLIANQESPKRTYPFKDYPVTEIYKGKNAPLKLTREEKRLYGEKLQYTMENYAEVEFAGHYIVAIWSCGMWCQWSAIIDAKTGKVYWWDGILSHCFPDLDTDFACNENFSNVEYRIDSKLIVFFGSLSYGEKRGFHYYKFDNGRFIHLKSVLVKEQRSTSEIMLNEADKKTNDENRSE